MKRVNKTDLIMSYLSALIWAIILTGNGAAQTTAFNYQGKLTDAGNLASGNYDLQFKLFDTVTVGTGTQQGSTVTVSNVSVSNGGFSVQLDFGANVFTGVARFLEVGVRPAGSPNPHTILAPRQAINSAPYAIQTVNATQLGALPASRYVATDVNGNVGIGTATPATKLEVVHPISQLRFGPSAADNGGYLVSTNPSQAIIAGGAKFDGTNWIARGTAASLTAHQDGVVQFLTNGNLSVGSPFNPTLRMHIDVSGFVGIGTSTPGQLLHVHGGKILTTGSDAAYLFRDRNSTSSADEWALYASGGKARLYNNTFGDVLTVTANGNVGIGTVDPQSKLSVAGNITQDRSSYGLPKAMVEVFRNGSIVRCYNAITGSSSGTCGFSAVYLENSDHTDKRYEVNFGFDVHDRFFSATPRDDDIGYGFIIVNLKPLSSYPYGEVVVHALYSPTSGTTRSSFYLVVY